MPADLDRRGRPRPDLRRGLSPGLHGHAELTTASPGSVVELALNGILSLDKETRDDAGGGGRGSGKLGRPRAGAVDYGYYVTNVDLVTSRDDSRPLVRADLTDFGQRWRARLGRRTPGRGRGRAPRGDPRAGGRSQRRGLPGQHAEHLRLRGGAPPRDQERRLLDDHSPGESDPSWTQAARRCWHRHFGLTKPVPLRVAISPVSPIGARSQGRTLPTSRQVGYSQGVRVHWEMSIVGMGLTCRAMPHGFEGFFNCLGHRQPHDLAF